jgi:hypothetical protein
MYSVNCAIYKNGNLLRFLYTNGSSPNEYTDKNGFSAHAMVQYNGTSDYTEIKFWGEVQQAGMFQYVFVEGTFLRGL